MDADTANRQVVGEMGEGREGSWTEESGVCDSFLPYFLLFLS